MNDKILEIKELINQRKLREVKNKLDELSENLDLKILELIRNCKEGNTIVWDEPNGEVYKIKLEKKYPKGWKPTKENKNKDGKTKI